MRNSTDKRIKFITYVFLILMLVLFAASFKIMIVDGKEYRLSSDTKRIKAVYTKAPRGDILDRNGKVLATSKNQFVVSLHSDELSRQKSEQLNQDFDKLVGLLEEDGLGYGEENPISIYNIAYKNEKDYLKEKDLALEKMAKIIVDEDLIKDFLELKSTEGYRFSNIARALNVLEDRSQKNLDVRIRPDSDFELEFNEELGEENDKDPLDYLVEEIDSNTAIISNMLDHPISRKLAYQMLEEKSLAGNLVLEDLAFKDDIAYINNKASLTKSYKEITMDSDPKDDFVVISTANLDRLLVMGPEGPEEKLEDLPGPVLIGLLEKELGQELKINCSLKDGEVKYSFEDGVESSQNPLEMLVDLAKDSDLLYNFLTSEEVKFKAQDANTISGDTPNISVLDFSYIFTKNKADILERYDIKKDASAKDALEKITKYYKIQADDIYKAQRLVGLNIVLESQGYRAFEPIVLSYGLKDETVAKLEEQIKNPGIKVDQRPVRYYPNGETAAHVLGYIGKISQPGEIRKFIEDQDYQPSDLIGKTGVEESFESALRGKDGKRSVQVDSVGNTTNVLSETPPVKGQSLYLSLDLDLQRVAEEALSHTLHQLREGGNFYSKWGEATLRINETEGRPHYNANSGAVVVLDVNTGEVLALANEKTYDPNLFSTGISQADWNSLFPEDEDNPLADRPLLNVAMQTEVSPGSIFKLVTALTGLENGMSPDDTVNCTGYIDFGDHRFGCWIYNQYGGAHGYENVIGAIRDSCNYYFYGLAMGENPNTGEGVGAHLSVEDLREYAVKLGLEDKTGIEINIPYEASGSSPNPEDKKDIIKNLLAAMLEEKLDDYLKEGTKLNPDTRSGIIRDIVSLVDEPEMDYDELESYLDRLGLDMEKSFEGSDENIAERIKYTYIDQAKWNITDMLNVVIGQGQNAYTPLQMANYVSTIANDGYRNKVSVVKEVRSADGSKVLLKNEADRERIELKNYDNLEYLRIGMNEASHFGSIEEVFGNFPVEIGLKTGTAEREGINPETGKGFDDYSWMIAFAPYDDPQIAICTLLYQSGSGSNGSAIIREIVGQYLGIEPEEPALSYRDLMDSNYPEEKQEIPEEESSEEEYTEEEYSEDYSEEEYLEDYTYDDYPAEEPVYEEEDYYYEEEEEYYPEDDW